MKAFPILTLLSVFLLSCSSGPTPAEGVENPNFLFILVDDMGWTDLGCFGSSFHETPHIDQLAANAMRFTNAYAACPVCSPTRASIMTGKYPTRTGVTDWIAGRQSYAAGQPGDRMLSRPFELEIKHEEITLAEALLEGGYRTFFAGKWHIGEDSVFWPGHQGFEINKGGWAVGSPRGGYFSPYVNPRLESGPEGEYLTDRLTDETISFIENQAQSADQAPFLAYLSFYTVHNPMQGKPEKVAYYQHKIDSLGLEQADMESDAPAWIETAPPRGRFVERTRQGQPVYAAMIESLDENVGRLMACLEENGMSENTVVIFMSDNGGLSTAEGSPTSNLPLRAGKGWLYEGGIREPMMIRWPGSQSVGKQCTTPVTSTDFYPTMLELAGLDLRPEQHLDGVSLVPLLQGDALEERPLFWHYPHYSNQGGKPGGVVRLGNYKLIERFETGAVELYDLARDIGEQHDLSSGMPEKAAEMLEMLHAWQEETGAEGMDPNPDWDPDYRRPIR